MYSTSHTHTPRPVFKVILERVEIRKLSKHVSFQRSFHKPKQELETVATQTVTPGYTALWVDDILCGSRGRGEDMTVWLTW